MSLFSLSSPIYTALSNPYAIKNLPVNTKEGAGDYLYMGKPIQSSPTVQSRPAGSASLEKPLIYMANNPYIEREESTPNLLEHLGAYQLIEKHFTPRA